VGGPWGRDIVALVRDAADIVRVVSDYVPLRQAGSRLKGLCPFHQEKTPSFSVDPDRQLFYCFGCRTGGDVFKFLMLYDKVEFPEALETLANRFGVRLPQGKAPNRDPLDRLLEMNEVARAFFAANLADGESGRRGRAYLERRGLTAETGARLRLGYAPDSWDALRSHLRAKGYRPDEMLKGGLVAERRGGSGEYDRFRDRLMFPIRDIAGRTLAFGGRTLGGDDPREAKYINSPETPAYTKGDHLYGLDLAKEAIRREGSATIVEGYLDLAAALQAGVDNVVASLGTAFTEAQARLLARYATRVVFSFDGDAAGASATARSVDLLLEKGFEVRVAELPADTDPDDFIRRNGAEAYGQLVRRAPEFVQFLIDREARGRDIDRADAKVAAVNAVLPHLARLSSAVERLTWVGRLADALRIDDDVIVGELRAALKARQTRIRQPVAAASGEIRLAESRLVTLLLRGADERRQCGDNLDWSDLEGASVAPIVRAILGSRRRSDGA